MEVWRRLTKNLSVMSYKFNIGNIGCELKKLNYFCTIRFVLESVHDEVRHGLITKKNGGFVRCDVDLGPIDQLTGSDGRRGSSRYHRVRKGLLEIFVYIMSGQNIMTSHDRFKGS